MGVMGTMRYFAGMRVHSLILASAMKTPCIGLAYAPKVRHFMELMNTPESLIELSSFKEEELVGHVQRLIESDASIRPAYGTRVDELKAKAYDGFQVFCDRYL
jgi:polysaccharide pyruvyl transferase WcaK-like protein